MSRLRIRISTIALALAKRLRRRAPSDNRSVRRVLLAHYLLFGDTLLLAPLLAKLAHQYPDAERIILVRPSLIPLFQGNPWGFQALAYDPRDIASFRAAQTGGPYDIAYVLGDNRYAWLARAVGSRWIVGFDADRPAWKNWMLDEAYPFPTVPSALADVMATLASGPPPTPFRKGDWPTPQLNNMPELPAQAYAVLHVGASTPLKLWPRERWHQLAEQLRQEGLSIVWSAGAGEESLVDAINPDHRDLRHCGSLNLAGLWHLLASAKLLVSPDTGVAHLGKIIGVPTLALFGPGTAAIYGAGAFWRNAPYEALTINDFPCRNQHLLFRRELNWVQRCNRNIKACAQASAGLPRIQNMSPCMSAISLEPVLAAARRIALSEQDS